MPSFEKIPLPDVEVKPESETEDRGRLEEKKEKENRERGFRIEDKMGPYREALAETEREIAVNRFESLSQAEKEKIIYQLYQEGKLPKSEKAKPKDNVVDFQAHRERKTAEVPTETKNREPEVAQPKPEISTPEAPPQTETAPQAETAFEPEPVPPAIHRWLTKLEPYAKRIDAIQKKLEAARASDRRNPRIHRLNPLGSALHASYPVIRQELNDLLKETRKAAQRENLAVTDPYVKKNLRRFISEIEQRIFELKSETSKLEHLKHPRRAAKKLFDT